MATRCARTCRRASASPRKTATSTCAASDSSPGCWPVTASLSSLPQSLPTRRRGAKSGALAAAEGIPFIEAFVNPALESLVKRDVKGLYKRALAGEIPHFTGVSDPYEPPTHPDVVIETDAETVAASVDRVLAVLAARGIVPDA